MRFLLDFQTKSEVQSLTFQAEHPPPVKIQAHQHRI